MDGKMNLMLASLWPGFSFCPTAEELLLEYLLPRKKHGLEAVPGGGFISDVDVYSKEPWSLFKSIADDGGGLVYVFTDLKKVATKEGKSKKNNQRGAGSGFWWGRNGRPVQDGDGNIIGMDHYYTFETKKSKKEKKNDDDADSSKKEHGHWTMHEYSLGDEFGDFLENTVICAVACNTQINIKHSESRSPSKKRRFPASGCDLGDISSKRMCTDSPCSVMMFPEPQEPSLGAEKEDLTAEEIEEWLQEDQHTTPTKSALVLPECKEAVTTQEKVWTIEAMEKWLLEDEETSTDPTIFSDSPSLVLMFSEPQEPSLGAEKEDLTAEEIEEWLQEDQHMPTKSALVQPECKEAVTTQEKVWTIAEMEKWLLED
ncbi:NAC domain-containing protein 2-like [Tripterygium wilfordii]|uniref:NAC domain-containing protein 2-like n=1 Tax=Tripterygium wilfordii TaxID=458696 RepID=UPI0018F8133A|nr:NAC domain-containing protein 2-like [Tripterygium wilfordii]